MATNTETQQIRELFGVLYDFIGATLDESVNDRERRNALCWARGACERYRHGDHASDAQVCMDLLRDGMIRLLDTGSIIRP